MGKKKLTGEHKADEKVRDRNNQRRRKTQLMEGRGEIEGVAEVYKGTFS